MSVGAWLAIAGCIVLGIVVGIITRDDDTGYGSGVDD